jgi:hypothetical protein
MYVHKYISLIIKNSQYSQISTYLISLHHIVKHLQVKSDDVKNNTKDKMSSKGTIHFIWECTCNIRLANLLDWVAYYIMQMYCTALFVHVIRYAEHDRTTDPEMESAGWQLARRKGRDVTCPWNPRTAKWRAHAKHCLYQHTRLSVAPQSAMF